MSSNTKTPTTPSADWERFKEQRNKERENGWKSLMDAFHKQSYQQRERFYSYHYKKKVDESLWNVGNFDLANRIENCGIHPKNKGVPNSNPVCKSPWCLGCRNRLYQRYYHKVRERLDHGKHQLKYFETLTPPLNLTEIHEGYEQSQYTNEDIRQINGVAGICGFNKDAVQHIIEEDYKRWRRIRRRLNKITGEVVWIEAVYELELVDWRKLKNSTFKRSRDKIKQMEQLIEHAGKEVLWEQNYFEYEPFVFVHWHGLTNLTREQQIEVFKKDYFVDGKKLYNHHEHGIYDQPLHRKKTLEMNINKICSYPFKNSMRYKHSYIGSDITNGEFFTPDELGKFISLYDEFIGRAGRQLFRSIGNDAVVWWEVNKRLVETAQSGKTRTPAMKGLSFVIQDLLVKIRKKGGGNMKGTLTPYINSILVRNKIKRSNWLYWKFQPEELVGWEKDWDRKMRYLKDPEGMEDSLTVSEQIDLRKEMKEQKKNRKWKEDTKRLMRIMDKN